MDAMSVQNWNTVPKASIHRIMTEQLQLRHSYVYKKIWEKAFLEVHDKLHERFDFAKTQEILGQNMYEGLKILENEYNS